MRKYAIKIIFLLLACTWAQAQETPRFTFVAGGGPTWPSKSTADVSEMSGVFEVGAGVNLSRLFGIDGEYMWNNLTPQPNIVALTKASGGSARMQSVTGNLLLHTPEEDKLGAYLIGGVGWYHRSWELTNPAIAIGSVCLPSYLWWGVTCVNGVVTANTTAASGSFNGFGWNTGGGLTYRLGDSHAKLFAELRFHQAFTKNVNTDVLPLTFGIRF